MSANQAYRGERIEEPVKGHPGIYEILLWQSRKQDYVDPRSITSSRAKPFRAVKRVKTLGRWSKQQEMFDTLEEAKIWKQAAEAKVVKHRVASYTVGELVADWRE
jgi:hypothetical protein